MLAFKYIYLDSNPLLGAGWPRISEKLQTITELAQIHHLLVFLPESVEEELEQHWVRDLSEKETRIAQSIGDRNKATVGVIGDLVAPPFPSHAVVLHSYREQAASLKKVLSIQSSPFTPRPLQEVFKMSASRSLPFKEKDKDFQDVVHLLSVIDHLNTLHSRKGAFVSGDRVFEATGIEQLERNSGVKLSLFKSFDELEKRLALELTAEIRESWKTETQAMLAKLESQRLELAAFIREHAGRLEIRALCGGDVVLAHPTSVELLEVTDIHAPPPQLLERPANEPLPVTIEVKVEVVAWVTARPPPFFRSEYRTERVVLTCEVEGMAVRRGQQIQSFKFNNVATQQSQTLGFVRALAKYNFPVEVES